MSCTKQLTYRGIVYQKPESSSDERKIISESRHIYRGKVYHYENVKKKVTS